MESTNPVFAEGNITRLSGAFDKSEVMTVGGTLVKTGWLLLVVLIAAGWSWGYAEQNLSAVNSIILWGSLIGFITAMVAIFSRPSPILVTAYAAAQGVTMGAFSYLFEGSSQGIVMQAITLTVGLMIAMFLLYAFRVVGVDNKVRSVIMISTFGVLVFYILSWIIGLISPTAYEFFNYGTTGLIIAALIVVIAALNLLLDFDFIENGAKKELPKQFEWYGAFGLMVTLIWLYISILRMLFVARN